MKKYTHAWIAFKAIERLEKGKVADTDRKYADSLIKWFKGRKDGVMHGAWYPDEVIKDMATSHVLKFTPSQQGAGTFRTLPGSSLIYTEGKKSVLYNKAYVVDPEDNLPERCEALTHSVIDNLRVQAIEPKGSPIAPVDNHIALILFMLSHYVADAHVPFHCDSRRFSSGVNLHGQLEEVWEKEVERYFDIDEANERFFYNREGYPLPKTSPDYSGSFLKRVEDELVKRKFLVDWGTGNGNVREYMTALCQYSYLLSYIFIPQKYNETNVSLDNWQKLPDQGISLEYLSFVVLSDSIDSIARIWLRLWRRYVQWKEGRDEPPGDLGG